MRYWKIAPGEKGFLWVEQRDHGCIAIGWSEVGDLNRFKSVDELRQAFNKIGYDSRPNQLWRFYEKVLREDRIVASSGKCIYGLGHVIDNYRFNDDLYYKHSKPVRWELKFWEPLNVEELALPQRTRKRLRLNRTILELTKDEWEMIDRAVTQVRSPFEGVSNFEGILRAPETEQEVIILFSKLSQHLKMKIESVSTRYPDAYVRIKKGEDWITRTVEFEINSSDFESHRHDPKECDIIICWNDDWDGKPNRVEVVELRKELIEII